MSNHPENEQRFTGKIQDSNHRFYNYFPSNKVKTDLGKNVHGFLS